MAKQVININASDDRPLINVGSSPDAKNGDKLRDAFIQINNAIDRVDSNFTELYAATAADVQIPSQTNNANKYLKTDGATLSWATVPGDGVGLFVTDFGEGFSLTAANKVVTNKLYSTNLTQPTQHYRLELDTNGVVHLPDQSIINGATLKTVPGNWAGITAGPVGHDEDSWVWVDNDGATIATKYSTDDYEWKFSNDGTLNLPESVSAGNAIIQTPSAITLQINANGSVWTFGTDGLLTFPGAEGFQATFGSVEPIGDVLHSVNSLVLESAQSVTINSGDQVTDLENTYIDAEETWVLIRNDDAMMIAPDTRPWDGMPSYEAYPVLMNYLSSGPPGGGVLPPNPNMPPVAKTASDAYDYWQSALTASGVNISVAGSHVWNFGADGELSVAGSIRKNGSLYLNSSGEGTSSSVVVQGDQGRVFVRTIDGATQNEWYFNEDGSTTFPNGDIKSPVTPQVGAFVTNLPDYDQVSDNNYIWVKSGPALVPVSELISRIGDMTGCIFTNNLGVEYTVIQDNSPNSTGGLNLVFDNALPAGHIYTVRSPDYSEKIAPALNVNVDENLWTFGNEGSLTFPDDTTIGASSIKFANNSSLGISNAAYDAALAGWEFIRGGEITDKINNNLVTAEGWPMVNWHPTGITASGYIDFLTMARAIQNSSSGAPLIIYPAMSTEFYNQMRSALIAIQYSYNLDSTAVSISSGYAKHWNFSEDGKLTLPAGNQIFEDQDRLTIDGTNGDGYVEINGTASVLIGYNSTASVALGNPQGGNEVVITSEKFRIINTNIPTQSVGSAGDEPGMIASDNDYIYRCVGTYDGNTNIWKRVALDATPWPVMYTLTVTIDGSGNGIVTSSPSGINSETLTATFVSGTVVTLSASSAMGSVFVGWAGPEGVSGTGTATVTMTSDISVTATFDLI